MTDQQKQWLDDLTAKRRKWIEANRENDFESGIKNLLTELYPDNAHFIYELLQNAEDAGARTVRFTLTDTCVEFEHDGTRLFSKQDIKSITSIGASAKKDDLTAIGKFGVGFKAVFAYTQTPEIHSGDFHFKIRDLVVPEAIPPCGVVNGKTTFIFPFDNPKKDPKAAVAEIERGLLDLSDNTLLFLSNIQEIEYLLPDGQTLGILKRIDNDRLRNAQAPSPARGRPIDTHALQPGAQRETVTHWLRYDSEVTVINDDGQNATCRVAAAFKLEPHKSEDPNREEKKPAHGRPGNPKPAWKIVPCDPGQISIFFPCDKEVSKLRFHLHAPFASTVARDSVRDCSANERLRGALASLIIEALPDIRDRGLLTVDFLSILPIPDDLLSRAYGPIRQAIVNAFKEQDLTPTKRGGYLKVGDLRRGPADISSVLDDSDLAFLTEIHPPPFWAANAPQRNGRADKFLDSLAIDAWGWEQLAEFFESVDFDDTAVVNRIEVWIKKKSDIWLMRFYGLLSHLNEQDDVYFDCDICKQLKLVRVETEDPASEPKAILHSFDDVKLDNIHPVRHVTAQEAFFPQEQGGLPKDVLFVKPEVYAKNDSEAQKTAAWNFLKSIGVREYNERAEIERRLEAYPLVGGSKKNVDNHFSDIRAFVAYWENHTSESKLFMEYHILLGHKQGDSQLCWKKPTEVCLDAPYMDTGLAVLSGIHAKFVLAADYLDNLGCTIAVQSFVDFLIAIGVMDRLTVTTAYYFENDQLKEEIRRIGQFDYLWKTSQSPLALCEDWKIIDLADLLKTQCLPSSRLIWSAILRAGKKVCKAQWRWNGKSPIAVADSQLVQHLKAAAWIPDKDGVFRKPQDMTWDMLPDGFPYDDRNGLLTAIGFGENAKKRSAEHQVREAKAREFGFSADELDELARAKKEGRLQITPKTAPEFPDSPVHDPARRFAKVATEVAAAPEKTYETRPRSGRPSKNGVDADIYLSNLYLRDGRMVCQCCGEEQFKKRNGNPYFEAVETFGKDVKKEHQAHYLAFCPLCAAKYKEFVKSDDQARAALKTAIQNAPDCKLEFDIHLDVTAVLRFTERHLLDLRAALSADTITGV